MTDGHQRSNRSGRTRIRGIALGLGSTFLVGLSVGRVGAGPEIALTETDRADEAFQEGGIGTHEPTLLSLDLTLADSSAEGIQNTVQFLARSGFPCTAWRGVFDGANPLKIFERSEPASSQE